MAADRLDELIADREQRIERCQGILEDRADHLSAQRRHRSAGQRVDTLLPDEDLAAGDTAGRLEQADDRGAGQGLSGARLTDDAEYLAARYRQRNAPDGGQNAAACRELDDEVADIQDRFGLRDVIRCGLGRHGSATPS